MLRRKPSAIKLELGDLAEYIEIKKQKKEASGKKDAAQINTTFEITDSSTGVTGNDAEAKRAQVQRRIGFSQEPIASETSTQFGNIH